MKKFLGAFALAGLVAIAGCDNSEDTFIQDPVLEETTPPTIVNEVIVPPAPPVMPADTMVVVDTAIVVPAPTTP